MHLLLLILFARFCLGLTLSSSQRQTIFPNSQPVQQSDLDSLIRQTGQPNPASAAIGVPSTCRCRHGFPQAFAMDPLPKTSGRVNSGLLKLTCPHLVRAVDSLEDEGLLHEMNHRLAESQELQLAAADAHNIHASVRRNLLDAADVVRVQSKLGERGAGAFLEAGVAGSSAGSTDAKCLHAWLADFLFRESQFGNAVVEMLQDRGVEISGTKECRGACDPTSGTLPTPPVPRNKQRLKTNKEKARMRRRKDNNI